VLAAYYLGYFIPALREGTTIGGVFVSSSLLVLAGRHHFDLGSQRLKHPWSPSIRADD
jgi:hypothetical protein